MLTEKFWNYKQRMVSKTKIEQVGKNKCFVNTQTRKYYLKITILWDLQIMKSQNVETGKNIAVLNYQFYYIINLFVSRAQNINFQLFQHRLAEAAAYKSLPPPTCDQQGDWATAFQECTWAQLPPSWSQAKTSCSFSANISKTKNGGENREKRKNGECSSFIYTLCHKHIIPFALLTTRTSP